MSNFNNKEHQKLLNNITINHKGNSVSKKTFTYGLNVVSRILKNNFFKILEGYPFKIEKEDLYSICDFLKYEIKKAGVIEFYYKDTKYGVVLKDFYIENISKDLNIKFYVGVDVGILKYD